MPYWYKQLPYDPLPILLESGSVPVAYFARRDLLAEDPGPVRQLWELRDAQKILRRQMKNGRWRYPSPGTTARSVEDYDQIETYRQVGFLVEKYGFARKHPALRGAAEFLFSRQTKASDFRGIYGRQYTPNYSAAIMELLIKAGYGRDGRIRCGLRWLLSMRQADGGWAIPFRTAVSGKLDEAFMRAKPFELIRTKPFSHMVTGMVLRPFVAHPRYRRHRIAKQAASLLKSRLFKPDRYPDRRGREYWLKFTFPFVFTDLLTALDTLGRMGFSANDPDIARGLEWFRGAQKSDGSFDLKIRRGSDKRLPYWLGYAVHRALRRFDS